MVTTPPSRAPPQIPGAAAVSAMPAGPSRTTNFSAVVPSATSTSATDATTTTTTHATSNTAARPTTTTSATDHHHRGVLANGALSDFFLRLTEMVPESQVLQPQPLLQQARYHYQQQQQLQHHHQHLGGGHGRYYSVPSPHTSFSSDNSLRHGMLRVTLVQAKLAKNYGLGRMDPYCKLTCGTFLITSSVVPNGAKEPRWNQVIDVPVQRGETELNIEIWDMGTFSDSKIAWGSVNLYDFTDGVPTEKWVHLSGKQGIDKEGVILMHFRFHQALDPAFHAGIPIGMGGGIGPAQHAAALSAHYAANAAAVTATGAAPGGGGAPGSRTAVRYGQPNPVPGANAAVGTPTTVTNGSSAVSASNVAAATSRYVATSVDIAQLRGMFPNLDDEIIGSVLTANAGNKEASVNALLSM